MRRFLGLMAAMVLATTILGCGGSSGGPNTGPVGGVVPKEQKEADDLMHNVGKPK